MKTNPFLFSILLFCLFLSPLHAQYVEEDSTLVDLNTFAKVECLDGSVYKGLLIEQAGRFLLLRDTVNGLDTRISMDSVKEVKYLRLDGSIDYNYNLQASRYFFGPNAFSIKRGEGYYQNNWVLLNQVSVGMTDNFTVGIATVPLFLFDLSAPTPVALTPKFTIPIKSGKLQMAVGGIYGTVLGIDYNNIFGITYGALTLGDRNANINLSVGFGMLDREWFSRPTVSLSAMTRMSHNFYLITENYYISDLLILSFGGRTVWKEVSLDYALAFLSPEFGELYPIPWLGVTVPFKIKNKK